MMLTTRRPPSRLDICNYNHLLYRDYDGNIKSTENYILSQSPPPMTYRDLRSVVSNIKSSNIVILPDSLKYSQTLPKDSPVQNYRKHSSRKKQKREGVNVYRALSRADLHCSILSERDITSDEIILLANSFMIEHVSSSATSGFFHPQNLPNIQKHRPNNNNNNRIESGRTKLRCSPSPSLRIQHLGQTRLTPVDVQYEYDNGSRTSHRKMSSSLGIQRVAQTRPTPVDIRYGDNNGSRTSHRRTSSSLRIQHVGHTQPTPPQLLHRTTPVDVQYEEDNSEMAIGTTVMFSSSSETPTRRQLHVYMPQTLSC